MLWVFRRWNIAGMTIFEFAAIGLAIAIGELAEGRRPGLGKFVLLFGCAAAAVWHGLRPNLAGAAMPIAEGD